MSARRIDPIPEEYTAVTPRVISRSTDRLIRFVTAAFDAHEIARVVGEDGSIGHAEFRMGDAIVLAFDSRPEWPDTPASFGSTWQKRMTHSGERSRPVPSRSPR